MYKPNKSNNIGSIKKHSGVDEPPIINKTDHDVVCKECGALKHNGTWTWDPLPNSYSEDYCPACLKIKNNSPGSAITLSGQYTVDHRDDLIELIHSIAAEETALHPLERLIEIERHEDRLIVNTTGEIMPRRIGYALNLKYHGYLETKPSANEGVIYYVWKKDS